MLVGRITFGSDGSFKLVRVSSRREVARRLVIESLEAFGIVSKSSADCPPPLSEEELRQRNHDRIRLRLGKET